MSFVFVFGGVVGNPVELFDLRHFSCADGLPDGTVYVV